MSSVRSTSNLRKRVKHVAFLGAAVLLAGACTTTSDNGDAGATPLPGIDGSTVKIGYLISDIGEVRSSLGFDSADYGTTESIKAGIEAVIDHVNANGGAGGRQIEAEIIAFDGSANSPEQSQQLCADLTQDRGVFAAVMRGQYHSNVIPCYAGANTLAIDATVIAHDQSKFEEFHPYLWTPSNPEYSSFFRTELEVLRDQGFLEAGQRVQLLTADDEISRRAADTIARPFLDDLGVSHVQTDYIDVTNNGTIGATGKSALQSGKSGNIDRVITVGGARILSIALADYEARDYTALFSMSTLDNPLFVQNNDASLQTERRPGMVGIGYQPTADVSTGRGPDFPDPNNSTQQLCVEIMTQAGAAPPAGDDGSLVRENWRVPFNYCDGTLFLAEALNNVGEGDEVTAEDFAAGVAQIGDALPSALAFSSNWGPGIYAGIDSVYALVWDESCACFEYTGDPITFSPEPVADTSTDGDDAGDNGDDAEGDDTVE